MLLLVLLFKTEQLYTALKMYNWMEYSNVTLNETQKMGYWKQRARMSCRNQLQERQNWNEAWAVSVLQQKNHVHCLLFLSNLLIYSKLKCCFVSSLGVKGYDLIVEKVSDKAAFCFKQARVWNRYKIIKRPYYIPLLKNI